ncbi:hypothetical protein C8R43DRAFT_1209548 [Mycena crocata]|nr:hypothetical protein C8R43DRAFT_1209548 [Mycena crocata]
MVKHSLGFRTRAARFFDFLICSADDAATLTESEDSTLVEVDAICHIKRVPDPVLSAIFKLGKQAEPEAPVERVISHVDTRWRAVALRDPVLWTAIDARHSAHKRAVLQWYLAHAAGRPLDIRISLTQDADNAALLLADVLAHGPRLRSLAIRADFPRAEEVVRNACASVWAPRLEHLSLIFLDQPLSALDIVVDEDLSPSVFERGVPKLAVLRLQHVEHGLFPPLHGITTLHLEEYTAAPMGFGRFRALLNTMPALANLSLYGDVVLSWPGKGGLHLPHLRSRTSGSLVLKDICGAGSSALHFPALELLTLDGPVALRALAGILCGSSAATELRLVNCDADDALQMIITSEDTLLPRLQRVMVHQIRDSTVLDRVCRRGIAVRVHDSLSWAHADARWTRLPHWPDEHYHMDADDLFMQLRTRRST